MSATSEFLGNINDGLGQRIEEQNVRPSVEVWPDEDDFGRWVAAHRDPVRSVICNAPEFADTPFCGRGIH
ncbi:MAG: hypothetical protein M0T73_12605 [Deltaproteobacteria bacterium]|nr:hypothetical protein [Deltaproteobacteria bacterium]